MGPRLSTGGNWYSLSASLIVGDVLQWGPVSRRGGTWIDPEDPTRRLLDASMGPRLSTGGNALPHERTSAATSALQWGPVSRRGGTPRAAPALRLELAASMGPRLSTG